MITFICTPCAEQVHEFCRGGTWCDCQCKVESKTEDTEEA